jgi:hypothetical protein
MSEQNTRELATHISTVLTAAQWVIGKAKRITPRPGATPVRVVVMSEAEFDRLAGEVAGVNAWLIAHVTGEVRAAAGNVELTRLFPDVRQTQTQGAR